MLERSRPSVERINYLGLECCAWNGDERDGYLYPSRCTTFGETITFAFSQSYAKMLKWGPVPNRLRSLLKTRSKYYIRWRTEFSGQDDDDTNNCKKAQNKSTASMASRIAASASVRAVSRVRKIRALRAPVTLVSIFPSLLLCQRRERVRFEKIRAYKNVS